MNDTQEMLRDAVGRALGDKVSPRNTAAAERDGNGIDMAAWQQLRHLGVAGGQAAAMDIADHAVVLQAIAQAAALVPYAESEALGRWLAQGAGIECPDAVLTVAPVEAGAVRMQNRASGAAFAMKGARIPWARHAHSVLLSFTAGGRCYVALRPAAALALRPGTNMAGEPHDVVGAESIAADAHDIREVDIGYGPDAVHARGALCRAAQMVGAMTRTNELTLQYARDRKQFSRSLSQYQVIQSYLAAMAGELCATAASVEAALSAAAYGDCIEEIAAAKIRAGQAARTITSLGHQIHGAIGFTGEYPLNLWTRRLWAWREEYGNEAQWAHRLGSIIVGHGADAFWPRLTTQSGS